MEINDVEMQAASTIGSIQGHTSTDYLLRGHGGLHIATEKLKTGRMRAE